MKVFALAFLAMLISRAVGAAKKIATSKADAELGNVGKVGGFTASGRAGGGVEPGKIGGEVGIVCPIVTDEGNCRIPARAVALLNLDGKAVGVIVTGLCVE